MIPAFPGCGSTGSDLVPRRSPEQVGVLGRKAEYEHEHEYEYDAERTENEYERLRTSCSVFSGSFSYSSSCSYSVFPPAIPKKMSVPNLP